MTDERLKEIQARCEAATPGPWNWEKDVLLTDNETHLVMKPYFDDDRYEITTCIMPHDAEFIAHARQDVPDLAIAAKGGDEHYPTEDAYLAACKALERAHAEIERLRTERDAAMEYINEMITKINCGRILSTRSTLKDIRAILSGPKREEE